MWSSSVSSGDDARQHFEPIRQRQRPDNEIPVSVPVDAVLIDTADIVAYVGGVRVFRAGVEFRLTVLSRHRGRGRDLGGALFGHGEQQDRLLLGVEYADGRTASNLGGPRNARDPNLDPATPVLMPGGGGGGGRSAEMSMYLTPLPPPGTLRIVTAWPSRSIAETVTEVPAELFTAAATGARVLWDLESEEPSAPPPAPAPPPGSWFERHPD
jgi:hypothetical protein